MAGHLPGHLRFLVCGMTHADHAYARARSSAGARGMRCEPRQAALFETLLPRLALDLAAPAPPTCARCSRTSTSVRLEIGFGGGEHLLAEAGASAHRLHRHRAVRQRHGQGAGGHPRAQAPNIRLHTATRPMCSTGCRTLRSRASTCSIRIHGRSGGIGSGGSCRTEHRRRSRASSGRAANSGSRRDWPDYVAWTLRLLARSPDFDWTAEHADDWRLPWPGFTSTRYEAKAKREGRVPCYLIFRRR